ncbi:glycine cleavage system T protein [Enterococcus haemoperoxidus ATCC BAA-382]|uniref:Aminomethyltransferase n=1 Tax=Enterococcus haemoperoxidus ATCC BAA-382 TaxID=1158608 RepID=R2QDU9_9ENTE|nr:glycine cleavage system aminomethyltransferase GcvT [Enterococcus haemoperoxidus]EOH93378.1 glycine cleavage system T protein [Enterococcus haemoperoxidus ATCC BAA-382]EOT61332.1 glycine cleavage system T protein [Enterococcus haemoperoxidus ATCC BAA-382]OJG54514.1 glycine cleavage system T protein [Enterococcus haemoperoxidus]
MDLKTPLYDAHLKAGGKMVSFAGYMLPVQYKDGGVIKEHLAVRNQVGLFDVSHMGEVVYEGKDALANLQYVLTNDFSNLEIGRVRYTLMCNKNGGVIDDLLVYKCSAEKYLLVVNAANREKDVTWMKQHLFGEVEFSDQSDRFVQIALQGPNAKEIIGQLTKEEEIPKKYYSFVEDANVGSVSCILSRTGYTGEFGYELYCRPEDGLKLWDLLLKSGQKYGIIPCGLGARDTLRLEAGMPLYGHEMTEEITPLETDLSFAVKMNKKEFIGKQAILDKGEPKITRIGLQLTERGIAREGANIYFNGKKIGQITSGTMCPFINKACAMALVEKGIVEIGSPIDVEVRGKKITAEVVAIPFVKK